MKILAIETSCDETGISIIDAQGSIESGVSFTLLADTLASQAELHSKYGGVYPTLAKREHIKALPILLKKVLNDAKIDEIQPSLDVIAVTYGPGLEPALWTGITFAQELSKKWNIPIVPVNHMEGHIFSTLVEATDDKNHKLKNINYPAVALLISGGHTEMVLIKRPFHYQYLGGTVDDAVGEAFDKVARMLGLGYPGGPLISKLAQEAREMKLPNAKVALPRPMIKSGDLNFSFSGLKTAVLYHIKKGYQDDHILTIDEQRIIAREFEDACADVLSSKALEAMQEHNAKTLIIGGGVAANSYINTSILQTLSTLDNNIEILTPYKGLSGDNALMIAIAGYLRAERKEYAQNINNIKAQGTLKL